MTHQHRSLKQAYMIWICVVAFYCYQFILRVSPGVMMNDLMATFHATASQVGEVASSYLVIYSLLQIPMGMLMDRWGARRVLAFALTALIAGGWIFSQAQTLGQATWGRMLIGIGSAPAFIGCSYVIRHWFPPRKVSMMLSLTMTISTIGAINGGAPLAWMIQHHGWRDALGYVVALGVGLFVVLVSLVRENKAVEAQGDMVVASQKVWHLLGQVMRLRSIWLAGAAAFGMYLPLSVFGDLWGVNYLVSVLEFSHLEAAWTTSLIYVGLCVGAPVGAWVADRMGSRRHAILLFSGLLTLGLLMLVMLPSVNHLWVQVLVFWIGFCIGSEVLCFAICCDWVPPRMTGVTVGFVNTLTMAGGAVLQWVVGRCLDGQWDGLLSAEGVRLYSPESYRWSMGILVLCGLGSMVCLMALKEKTHTE